VEAASGSLSLRFPGVLRAKDHAALAFSVSGRLESRSVELGDRVRAGQEVARLNTREQFNAKETAAGTVAEIRARLAQAESERQRVERLAGAGAATAEELEAVQAGAAATGASLQASESRLLEAQRRLKEGTLRAPFAGTVSAVYLDAGEYAASGKAVVEISGDGALELEVGVPEGLVAELVPGVAVEIRLPLLDGVVTQGLLRSKGQAATGSASLFPVLIDVPRSADLAAGMTAEAVLERSYRAAVTVPLAAIINPGGTAPAVFRLADSRAQKVPVTVEQVLGERVLVHGALTVGDVLVVRGNAGLLDGETVEVLP
jgi:RND family efflux transporter MFP subunit